MFSCLSLLHPVRQPKHRVDPAWTGCHEGKRGGGRIPPCDNVFKTAPVSFPRPCFVYPSSMLRISFVHPSYILPPCFVYPRIEEAYGKFEPARAQRSEQHSQSEFYVGIDFVPPVGRSGIESKSAMSIEVIGHLEQGDAVFFQLLVFRRRVG